MERIEFNCKDKRLFGDKETLLCGIINVTPDSFSDGGKYFSTDSAVERARQMLKEGASILDIGGESTRPGSTPVEAKEEIERIVPVIQAIKKEMDVIVSVDTWKSQVAQAAIEAGADIINDITGLLGDVNMAKVVGDSDAGLVLMFNPVLFRPDHASSKKFPIFGKNEILSQKEMQEMGKLDILDMMMAYFEKILAISAQYGIDKKRIMLDPGIGFGLTKKENLQLIQNVNKLHDFQCFSFLGVSRKRFLVNILQENEIQADLDKQEGLDNVDYASAFLTAIAAHMGVNVLRVHDIKKHFQAKAIADAIRLAQYSDDIHFEAYKEKK